jgi:hypothetical protein
VTATPEEAIAAIAARFDQLQKRSAPILDERESERAAAATKGELGPAWQKIQQRVNLGQTTLAKVFDGSDDSREARDLRKSSKRNMNGLREEYLRRINEDEGPRVDAATELDELRAMSEKLAESAQALRDRLGQ